MSKDTLHGARARGHVLTQTSDGVAGPEGGKGKDEGKGSGAMSGGGGRAGWGFATGWESGVDEG